jgi:hypothetical protein
VIQGGRRNSNIDSSHRLSRSIARSSRKIASRATPHFTIRQWADSQPFRDEQTKRHFVDGYLKAGLPE